jgi:hypothetical protein
MNYFRQAMQKMMADSRAYEVARSPMMTSMQVATANSTLSRRDAEVAVQG